MSREFQLQEKPQSVPTLAHVGLMRHRAANEHAQETVPPIVHEVLRSPGQPLDPATRALLEPRFGHDFNHVRVHTDAKSAESARAVDALAFTVGRDIFFCCGQYHPSSIEGKQLLAHELTHVVQQGKMLSQGIAILGQSTNSAEAEAVQVADQISAAHAPHQAVITETAPVAIQRQTVTSPTSTSPTPISGKKTTTAGPSASMSSPAPAAALPAPASEAETIANAIHLFMASITSTTPMGKKALAALRKLQSEKEIEFEELKESEAEHREGPQVWLGEEVIAVNPTYRKDVIMTSLQLVHEAVHEVLKKAYVDEELAARNLQIEYYNELQGGITFGRLQYRAAKGFDPALEYQRDKKKTNELIDVIFSWYWDEKSFFDAKWVEFHIDDWGGLSKRWPFTKAFYLRKLINSDPIAHASTILKIMESEASNSKNIRNIVEWVGGEKKLRKGLHYLLYEYDYWYRIKAIQELSGVYMGAGSLPEKGAKKSE